MPRISFTIRTVPFVTDLGISVPAQRPFLAAQFLGAQGQRFPYPAFLDTGSAYSVIPYRLASQVPWRDLGAYMILAGASQPIEWHGIPCRMGELEVELVDTHSQIRTRVLRVVAKVASQPAARPLEQAALLGMNFILDNGLRQELDASGPNVYGSVWAA